MHPLWYDRSLISECQNLFWTVEQSTRARKSQLTVPSATRCQSVLRAREGQYNMVKSSFPDAPVCLDSPFISSTALHHHSEVSTLISAVPLMQTPLSTCACMYVLYVHSSTTKRSHALEASSSLRLSSTHSGLHEGVEVLQPAHVLAMFLVHSRGVDEVEHGIADADFAQVLIHGFLQ